MITLTDVRNANGNWFSSSNKRLFGDINYRLLTGKKTGDKYLVRLTNGWSDMFGQPKRQFYKINAIDQDTLKIKNMLDPEFESMDEVRDFLKTK